MTRIAFIGVGTMGLPIARNLLAAGHELVPCDVDPVRAAVLGVEVAQTPREAAAETEDSRAGADVVYGKRRKREGETFFRALPGRFLFGPADATAAHCPCRVSQPLMPTLARAFRCHSCQYASSV